jgi:hypothetical protein
MVEAMVLAQIKGVAVEKNSAKYGARDGKVINEPHAKQSGRR